jgi:hypothetical protein
MHGAAAGRPRRAFQTNHTLFFRYLGQQSLGVAKLVSNNNGRISVGGKLKNNFNFSAKTSHKLSYNNTKRVNK